MSSPSAIASGFRTVLNDLGGSLRAYDGWPDTVNTPCAIPRLVEMRAETIDRGTKRWTYELLILTSLAAGLQAAQRGLAPYLDDSGTWSIEQALLGDATLNGAAQDILSIDLMTYDSIRVNDIDYLGAVYRVEVLA